MGKVTGYRPLFNPKSYLFGDGDTEMVFLASARLKGSAHQMTYNTLFDFDNDPSSPDGYDETEYPQYRNKLEAPLFYDVECHPPSDLEVNINLYENDGSDKVADLLARGTEIVGKIAKVSDGYIALAAEGAKALGELFKTTTTIYASKDTTFKAADIPVDGTAHNYKISHSKFYAWVEITRTELGDTTGCEENAEEKLKLAMYTYLMGLHLDKAKYGEEFTKKYKEIYGTVTKEYIQNLCKPTKEDICPKKCSIAPYQNDESTFEKAMKLLESIGEIKWRDFEWGSGINVNEWIQSAKSITTKLLQSSAENMSDLAEVFTSYTVDPRYDDYMENAADELSIANEHFESGEFAEAIAHYHNSWNFSRLAIGVADNIQPYAAFDTNVTDGILTVNAWESYDLAGPLVCCPDNYTWDFGDGTVGYGIFEQHAYASTGTYDVTLTVTDKAGNVATAITEILVEEVQERINLTLVHPMDRYLYLFGFPLMPFDPNYHPEVHVAVLLGPSLLTATAESPAGIEKVGFSIDGGIAHWDYNSPYIYFWWPPFLIGLHTVEVIAYDNTGSSAIRAQDVITVWFLPGGEYGP